MAESELPLFDPPGVEIKTTTGKADAALGAFLAGGVAGALLAYAMGAKLPRQRRRRPYGRFRAAASSAYESSRWARRIPQGGWKASKAS